MKQLKAPGFMAPKAPRWASRALIIEGFEELRGYAFNVVTIKEPETGERLDPQDG